MSKRNNDKCECIHFMYKICSVNYFLFFLIFPDLLAKKTAKILMKDKKNLMFPLNKENVGQGYNL